MGNLSGLRNVNIPNLSKGVNDVNIPKNDGELSASSNLEKLYENINNTVLTQENNTYEEAREILTERGLAGGRKRRFQNELEEVREYELSAKNIGDFTEKIIFEPRFIDNAIMNSMVIELTIRFTQEDGAAAVNDADKVKYGFVDNFYSHLIEKFNVTLLGSKEILNNNKSCPQKWRRLLMKNYYMGAQYDTYLKEELNETFGIDELDTLNSRSTGVRPTGVSYTGLTNRKTMAQPCFTGEGKLLRIPLSYFYTLFKSSTPIPRSMRFVIELLLEKDTRKYMENNVAYTADAATQAEKLKLHIVGTPKLQWKEVSLTTEAKGVIDNAIKAKTDISPDSESISSFNISEGRAFQLLSYVQENEKVEFIAQPEFYWQPERVHILLVPLDSWNHDHYFDTHYVNRALQNIRYIKVKGINKNAIRTEEYDWSKPEDKYKLYEMYRALKTGVNLVSSFESQINDANIKPGKYVDTYDGYWHNNNSNPSLVIDLTVDRGFTVDESLPQLSSGLEFHIKYKDDSLTGVHQLVIIGETTEFQGLYNKRGVTVLDYAPRSLLT